MNAPLAENRDLLERAGWKRNNYSRCSGCRAPVEWWTTPKGSRMPMDPMPDPWSAVVSHFATCPHAGLFRKRGGKGAVPESNS